GHAVRVNLELRSHGQARGVVALRAHAGNPAPHHDEARAGARHGRRALDAGRVRVHAEFGAQRRTDGGVTLAEDAVAVPILAPAGAHHQAASVRGRGHSRGALYVGGIRVDLEFRATRIAARI